MNKLILLGLLVMLGLSFAAPTPVTGPEGKVYVQTCCQAYALVGNDNAGYDWAFDIEDDYEIWDGGCSSPSLLYDDQDIWDAMWFDDNSVKQYYYAVLRACEGSATSPGCLSAKAQFYSSAKNARGMFAAARANYLMFARQDLLAYYVYECEGGEGSESVSEDIYYALVQNYRNCINNPTEYCFATEPI